MLKIDNDSDDDSSEEDPEDEPDSDYGAEMHKVNVLSSFTD